MQHEDASIQMFDYIYEDIETEFEKYDFEERDRTFVKEMIRAPRGPVSFELSAKIFFGDLVQVILGRITKTVG